MTQRKYYKLKKFAVKRNNIDRSSIGYGLMEVVI